MKKLIPTLVLAFFIITISNAQIRDSKVLVKTKKVKTIKENQGFKLSVKNLKTVNDLKKLNLKTSIISKEKLNAKPTRTWKINPWKMKDGFLELKSLFGIINKSYWQTGIQVKPNQSGFLDYNSSFPIAVNFRAIGGVEYRLKLKNESGQVLNYQYVYLTYSYVNGRKSGYVQKIELNRSNEINYVFKEDKSENITIGISYMSSNNPGSQSNYIPLIISKIQIDRIN